jgi:hypothetical protein
VSHHKIAWIVVAASAVLVVVDGWAFSVATHIALWHGIYCIWMTGITVGGDVAPVRWGYACLAFAPFPLLATAFSLFTSALANIHVRRAEKTINDAASEIKGHVTACVPAGLNPDLAPGVDVGGQELGDVWVLLGDPDHPVLRRAHQAEGGVFKLVEL